MVFHTCKPNSRKWPIVYIPCMIDIARVNSATIHAINCKDDPYKVDTFEDALDLAMQRVQPFIEEPNLSRCRSFV